jgi:hypothetical protein
MRFVKERIEYTQEKKNPLVGFIDVVKNKYAWIIIISETLKSFRGIANYMGVFLAAALLGSTSKFLLFGLPTGIGTAVGMLVINALGRVHMDPMLDSPFTHIDRTLRECEGKYDFAILDIHAEATGEKLAVGYAYDGKINIVFGTHTHAQTADGKILPRGTGYISDIGMCGESGGILGMDAETVVLRMRSNLPHSFKAAAGKCHADGVIFTIDTTSGRVTDIESVGF